jgi:hypothetical protein
MRAACVDCPRMRLGFANLVKVHHPVQASVLLDPVNGGQLTLPLGNHYQPGGCVRQGPYVPNAIAEITKANVAEQQFFVAVYVKHRASVVPVLSGLL